jgi:hypothetical protein
LDPRSGTPYYAAIYIGSTRLGIGRVVQQFPKTADQEKIPGLDIQTQDKTSGGNI